MTGAGLVVLGLASIGAGCSTTRGRAYERDELRSLPLRSIEVVVVASAPIEVGEQLRADAFEALEPVRSDTSLSTPDASPVTRDALARALEKGLEASGYDVEVQEPGPRATLATVLERSASDVVLIVRVVPVDRFHVSTWSPVELDRRRRRLPSAEKPPMAPRTGRLLVGQVFAFDRTTGLRLWSRDLPDLPEDGWIHRDSPVLSYGVVLEEGDVVPERQLAAAAAQAYVGRTFDSFPDARSGDEQARAALDSVDPEQDRALVGELDRGRAFLEVEAGWSLDDVEASVKGVDDREERGPALGTSSLAPRGVFRLAPRFAWQLPGGALIGIAVPLGVAPNASGRSFVRDDFGVGAELTLPLVIGVAGTASWTFLLSPSLSVQPGAGVFIEWWRLGSEPRGVIESDGFGRGGGFVEGAARLSLGSWHFRAASRAKLGLVTSGAPTFGLDFVVGGGVEL